MGEISELEGLLSCFKCKFKIGRFRQIGQQCSCDEWITPCFQISVSKVDISRKKQKVFKIDQTAYFTKESGIEEKINAVHSAVEWKANRDIELPQQVIPPENENPVCDGISAELLEGSCVHPVC